MLLEYSCVSSLFEPQDIGKGDQMSVGESTFQRIQLHGFSKFWIMARPRKVGNIGSGGFGGGVHPKCAPYGSKFL